MCPGPNPATKAGHLTIPVSPPAQPKGKSDTTTTKQGKGGGEANGAAISAASDSDGHTPSNPVVGILSSAKASLGWTPPAMNSSTTIARPGMGGPDRDHIDPHGFSLQ
jgi:hypothetical protein